MAVRPGITSKDVAVLQRWARLGRNYAPRRASRRPDWSAVERLTKAAAPYLRDQAGELRDLLQESSTRFGMEDPLLADLGTHRWLDKETSYSDWLAWVLEHLEPSAVFDILDVERPANLEKAGRCHVQRESQLDKRYIDLLISFDGISDVIGVEVKTYDEQYAKQKYYLKRLKSLYPKVPCVLIDREEREHQRYGFDLRLWREVALALREKIAEYARKNGDDNRIVTAMMLGFVAAVEQNLLEFSPAAPRRAWRRKATMSPKGLVEYLTGEEQE